MLDVEGCGDFRIWDMECQRLIKCVIKFTEWLSKRNAIYIKILVCLSTRIKGLVIDLGGSVTFRVSACEPGSPQVSENQAALCQASALFLAM